MDTLTFKKGGSDVLLDFDDTDSNVSGSKDAKITVDCPVTTSSAEMCDWSLSVVEEGEMRHKIRARTSYTGAPQVPKGIDIDLNPIESVFLQNTGTDTDRNIEFVFRDWADIPGGNKNSAYMVVNCAEAGTNPPETTEISAGQENCAMKLGVQLQDDSDDRPNTQLLLDGINDTITLGSARVGTISVETDGSGDAELELPNDSVGASELDLAMNSTWTGAHNFGDASSLEIPNSGSPTFSADGQVALDTTQDQIRFDGAGGERTLDYRRFWDKQVYAPASATSYMLFCAPFDITIAAIHCIVDPADSDDVTGIRIRECDTGGDSCSGIDGSTTVNCDNGGEADDGAIASPTIEAGNWTNLEIVNVASGTPAELAVTLTYVATPK